MKRKGFAFAAAVFFVLAWDASSWAPTERELPGLLPVNRERSYEVLDAVLRMGDDSNVVFLMKDQEVRRREVLAVVRAYAANQGYGYESALAEVGNACPDYVVARKLAVLRPDGDNGAAKMKCWTHNTLLFLSEGSVSVAAR